jgi:hypothetical protein
MQSGRFMLVRELLPPPDGIDDYQRSAPQAWAGMTKPDTLNVTASAVNSCRGLEGESRVTILR